MFGTVRTGGQQGRRREAPDLPASISSPLRRPMPETTAAPDLSFPIGRAERRARLTPDERRTAIDAMAAAPAALRAAVRGLTEAQLDTPYRPGGWSVRQVVHHVADSHMNAYLRFKFALTED